MHPSHPGTQSINGNLIQQKCAERDGIVTFTFYCCWFIECVVLFCTALDQAL